MAAVAQRLAGSGVPMVEYPQTVGNLTAMGSNLYELIKGANLVVYPDKDVRLAISRAIAKETPRGFQITKEKSSHKIDVVIALAMAARAAVANQRRGLTGADCQRVLQQLRSAAPQYAREAAVRQATFMFGLLGWRRKRKAQD
jgi:phage terminase large subunit-like protein